MSSEQFRKNQTGKGGSAMKALKVPDRLLNKLDEMLQQLTEAFTPVELECTEPLLMGKAQCVCAGSCKGDCKTTCKHFLM